MATHEIPTPGEYAGGLAAFDRLTACFYEKVRGDELLGPVFSGPKMTR